MLILFALLFLATALILANGVQELRNKTFLNYSQVSLLMITASIISVIISMLSTSIIPIICNAIAACIWGYNLYTYQTSKLGKSHV